MSDAGEVPVHVRLAIARWPSDAPHGAVAEFCRSNGISRSWFYQLRARAGSEGLLGVAKPRSRRPLTSPARIGPDVVALVVLVHGRLSAEGWDAGPISVRQALLDDGLPSPSRASLARILARLGLSTPSPGKRPRSTRRFCYAAPNECWQLDGFDHHLADHATACALQVLDDHPRRVLASRAAPGERSEDAQLVVSKAIDRFGVPQRFLSDNGAALNPSRRGRRGLLEAWLRALGVQVITSTPGHPQTQGKSERHHQTTQRWLAARDPAITLEEFQAQLDAFEDAYNQRPHQSLGMLTPMQAWAATPVAPPPPRPGPGTPATNPADGVVATRLADDRGIIRIAMCCVNLGIEHARATVLTTRDGHHIHIWDREGLHLTTVTPEPGRRYYGNGRRNGRLR